MLTCDDSPPTVGLRTWVIFLLGFVLLPLGSLVVLMTGKLNVWLPIRITSTGLPELSALMLRGMAVGACLACISAPIILSLRTMMGESKS